MQPPEVPDDDADAGGEHEHGEVPEGVVEHAGRGAEEDEDARGAVGDGLLAELDGGEEDDADDGGVEAGEEGVHGRVQRRGDGGDAEGEGVGRDGGGERPDEEGEDGGEEAAVQEVDAVEHLCAAGAGEGLADGEDLLVLWGG